MSINTARPSIICGLRVAVRMWALAVVMWLVNTAVFVPVSLVLHNAAADVLGHLPDNIDLPAGEGAILVFGVIRDVAGTVFIGLIVAVFLSWVWTVLWHAGVARSTVWDPDGPAGVSRVLGLGLGAWWRYCRMSAVALIVLIALLVLVWMPLGTGVKTAFEAMDEDRMVLLIGIGLVLSPFAKFLVWGATLRGAWVLARPDARSSLKAWLRGLVGVFRQPFSTFGTLLVLGLGQAAFGFLPVVAPVFMPALRGTGVGIAVASLSTLVASFLMLALFAAFAPVSGVVFQEKEDGEA